MITVLICDDSPIARMGLRMIIDSEPDMTVVGAVASGEEAISAARVDRPDVVLLDIQMPGVDGITAARRIESRVLILTTFDHDENVHAALRAGVSGFLVKDAPPERVVEAVRAVAEGGALLSPSVTRRLLNTVGIPGARLPELSDQDVRLLKLIARARTNSEIARELDLTLATVKTYVSRLFTRINARDRTHAAVLAYESGLARPGS
ncbi:response regulator [Actinocrispum wychmicini]|uniref:DNA-binding NarL/FixJ family response regulator n=1 Tax=Actinocrispum wychmicini TaxID=1213861 RepID=A0A4R2K0F0_9PSEU|nr:response regulator transcription factor [Actinocrispum wychmicini]TCO65082.1 DNA-binding NarL/FixJ family response regulator [Actinocrispum wychmicini]